MLERSPGVARVTQLAAAPRYPGSVVLEDAGEASLAGRAKPLPADKPFSRQRRRAAAESGRIRLLQGIEADNHSSEGGKYLRTSRYFSCQRDRCRLGSHLILKFGVELKF